MHQKTKAAMGSIGNTYLDPTLDSAIKDIHQIKYQLHNLKNKSQATNGKAAQLCHECNREVHSNTTAHGNDETKADRYLLQEMYSSNQKITQKYEELKLLLHQTQKELRTSKSRVQWYKEHWMPGTAQGTAISQKQGRGRVGNAEEDIHLVSKLKTMVHDLEYENCELYVQNTLLKASKKKTIRHNKTS